MRISTAADCPRAVKRTAAPMMSGLLVACLGSLCATGYLPVASAATPPVANVTVTAPRPPTAQQLAGPSVPDFISHHAVLSVALGQLTRWHTGICPVTRGLSQGFNAFISARIRAIAASIGAPVGPEGHCKANVEIFFTTQPRAAVAAIAKAYPVLLGMHYHSQNRQLEEVSRPVQGWYVTATRGQWGSRVLDHTWAHSMWGPGDLLDAGSAPACAPGSRLSTECSSEIVNVFIVADTTKVAGYAVGSISDYLAVVALSMVQSLDVCDPLPSILDLLSPSCRTHDKPDAITAGDLAFLRALYRSDLTLAPSLERGDIDAQMMRQFGSDENAK
jgi:hypothetical protein